jgi:adenylate kinase
MDVEYGELTRRISGRRTCSDCGRVFNLFTAAGNAQNDICPKTGAPHRLFQRPDDNEATVAQRLKVYEEKTKPLVEFYRGEGKLRSIDAEGDVEEITRRLEEALSSIPGRERTVKERAATQPAARKSVARQAVAKRSTARQSKAVAKKSAVRARKKSAPKKSVPKKSLKKKAVGRKSATAKAKKKQAARKK